MTYDLRIQRLIDAAPDVVFDAFVDPEAQKELYNNEEDPDWHVESELDLRVGGTWTIVFGNRGEEPFRLTSVFSEVDRPRRLVFKATLFQGKYGGSFDTDVTVTFEDRDGKTLMTIVETGFPTKEQRDMIEGGWPSILDALERVVTDGRST
ncbi:MAG TPA: SRPBCC domain-containing protein [Actinomycetota bacterium]|nr:SRPBCC domain-containing protein [Actinomycetota bacterium]